MAPRPDFSLTASTVTVGGLAWKSNDNAVRLASSLARNPVIVASV
ncbi:MAG: hypothetical protein NTZ32_20490 [Planctomycetales bacterium]|nr:hypothetical protein [Planctomycetales bacterium]